MGRICRHIMSARGTFVATCRNSGNKEGCAQRRGGAESPRFQCEAVLNRVCDARSADPREVSPRLAPPRDFFDRLVRRPPAAATPVTTHVPESKMGAGVATGPHLSRVRTAAPVRAWRLSWAGRTPSEQAPREFGVPAEVLRPRSVPYEHLPGEPGICPFAVPSAEASGSAWTYEEIGIGLRLTLLPRQSFHRFGGLRSEDRRPLPRWSRFRAFFPCGKSTPHREGPQ
jgi:hypothetical protein